MSIWFSGEHIGTESGDWYEVAPGMTMLELGDGKATAQAAENGYRKVEHKAERGQVRAYREGFSNHYPDETDGPALICLATIAPWCTPGHGFAEGASLDCARCGEQHEYPETGEWIRLDVSSPHALSWWTKDGVNPTPAPVDASVVLDVEAARSLAADLLEWADGPHLEAVGVETE